MPQAFCMKCKKNVEIKNPRTVVLKNKAIAVTGICPISETRVYKFIHRYVDPIQALEIAIEREKESQQFYNEAAAGTEDSNGKKMLQWLAKEEKWHQAGLEKQLKALMNTNAWEEWKEANTPISIDEVEQTAETAHTREATSYEHITVGEVSALRTGMRAEKKAMDYYKRFGEAVSDARGKRIFASLAKQEEGHLNILKAAIKLVTEHKRYPFLPRFLV
ncbi:ferritin family protein [Chloroflexota bacterium]